MWLGPVALAVPRSASGASLIASGGPLIGRRPAQILARRELNRVSIWERILHALSQLFNTSANAVPGGWFGLVVFGVLFVVLIVGAKWGSNILSLALIIGIFSWLIPARLVRGEVLTLRVRDFVAAARAAGSGRGRMVLRHLIPNALSVVVVNITFQVADAILLVAALGFLGFGLNFPVFDWGDLLSNGTQNLLNGYWWQIYPVGICIVLTVMAMNLIGDALRDALDVRLRRR